MVTFPWNWIWMQIGTTIRYYLAIWEIVRDRNRLLFLLPISLCQNQVHFDALRTYNVQFTQWKPNTIPGAINLTFEASRSSLYKVEYSIRVFSEKYCKRQCSICNTQNSYSFFKADSSTDNFRPSLYMCVVCIQSTYMQPTHMKNNITIFLTCRTLMLRSWICCQFPMINYGNVASLFCLLHPLTFSL